MDRQGGFRPACLGGPVCAPSISGGGGGTLLAGFLAATAAAETKLAIHLVVKIPVEPRRCCRGHHTPSTPHLCIPLSPALWTEFMLYLGIKFILQEGSECLNLLKLLSLEQRS